MKRHAPGSSERTRNQIEKPVKSQYKPLVPAVEQASRILVCLSRGPKPKMRLIEICKEVGIHYSKGFSILNTLNQFGFVEKDPQSKTYSLGVGLVSLARNVLDHLDLRDFVVPYLEELTKETRQTTLFGLIRVEQVFVIAKHESGNNIGVNIKLGHRFHMTSGAHGKAIVAFMTEVDRERILARKRLYFYGDSSQMNLKQLRDELAQCRRLGFARDVGDMQPGINAVSAPVFGPDGKIIGCVILMGTFPEALIETYGQKVNKTVSKISSRLGADVSVYQASSPLRR